MTAGRPTDCTDQQPRKGFSEDLSDGQDYAGVRVVRRALRGLPAAFDVVVVNEEYAEEWKDVHGTVVNAALEEGQVVHG